MAVSIMCNPVSELCDELPVISPEPLYYGIQYSLNSKKTSSEGIY